MFASRWLLGALFAIASLAFAACGDEETPPAPPVTDRTPPTVVEVLPPSGATISVARAIRVVFSEAMRDASLALGGAMNGDGITATWPTRTTLELTPTTAWAAGASRTLTVDAVDTAGNALAQLTLTYTVDDTLDATAPTATILPADAATIATAQPIVVTFSESMATASLVLGGSLAPQADGGTWSQALAANDRLTIAPTTAWPEGNRTLSVAATDLAGNPLASLLVTYTIDAGATVIDAVPPTGVAAPATGSFMTPGTAVVVTFDEAMNPGSLTVTGTLGGVSSATWNVSNTVLTLHPMMIWPEGAGTLIVNAADLAGNAMATLSLSYTVDGTAPTATATPTNGGLLAGDATITIQFSEAILPASLVLGGSLELESDGGTWSDADTLVIAPETSWTTATGATLTIDATDLAGNELATLSLTYDVDATGPTLLSVSSPDGAIIPTNTVLQLTFSESLDTTSLSLGGTLLAASYTTTFLQSSAPNDRLRISPAAGGWNVEVGQTLVVDVADLAGNGAATVVLTYDVGVVHVRTTNCVAAGPGTRTTPFCAIPPAVATTNTEVRVAAGTYNVNLNTPVTVPGGRRVLGGYATDWSGRDPATHVSTIAGTGSGGGTFQAPVVVGSMGGGGSNPAVFDGFTVQATTGFGAEAIGAEGNARVTNNQIITSDDNTTGVTATNLTGTIADNTFVTAGPAIAVANNAGTGCTITHNQIDVDTDVSTAGIAVSGTATCAVQRNDILVTGSTSAIGIQVDNASPVRNNVVAAFSTTGSVGIRVGTNAAPPIQNNTIVFSHRGLEIILGGPLVENNIFLGSLTAGGVCIYEGAGSTSPTAVRYNDFYDCGSFVYHDSGGTDFAFVCSGTISTNCSGGTALTTPAATSNTDANPALDTDYALTASSPEAVTEGGNTIVAITDDIDGTPRTAPYSIGAFERDP